MSVSTEKSRSTDPMSLAEIGTRIAQEESLSERVLHLTANETLLSPSAQRVLSTPLSNRYLLEHLEMREGSPSRLNNFLYRGMDHINAIEASAAEVCRRLFGAEHVEFRCLSGIHAMQTTFVALSQPGDKIMRISTKDGGHFLTELICRSFGRRSCTYAYRTPSEMDLDRTREVFRREKPTLLFLDAMNYLFPFPVQELKEMCGDVPLVYDASHTLGLIAGGQFQDPLGEGADILQANTHKTLFGPQKGIILGKSRGLMERISYTMSNGLVSSQHTASTLALFIALHEMYQYGREYAARVVESARYLAAALSQRGVPILAADRGFTHNHMFFIDTRPLGAGPALLERLLENNIAVNRLVAFEHTDALRVGVQEVVRRGFTPADFDQVADWISGILLDRTGDRPVRDEVAALLARRRTVGFCDPASGAAPPASSSAATVSLPAGGSVAGNRSAPRKPRWINTRLRRESIDQDASSVAGARTLGAVAGVFEHQTDSAGNISFRYGGSTYVTASGAYIRDLQPRDFVELQDCAEWTLTCRGAGPPSAESYMHYLIRSAVPAAFVVHNHYIPADDELGRLDVLVIPPKEYGSVQLAEAVTVAAEQSRLIYVRRHGLVLWSETFEEGRDLLVKVADAVGGPTLR
jgi:fluorothreonine transaldolase